MYQMSPVSDRIARIRKKYRTTKPKVDLNRYKIVTDFYKSNPDLVGILKRAENLKNLFEKMPTPIFEDELIVGFPGETYRCCALFPEGDGLGWMLGELDTLPTRSADPYDITEEDKEYGLGVIYPSVEEIAQAIAKRDNAKIVPTGAYALNRLGLSTQIPMNVVFLTNGAPRRVKIGDGHGILFKHSSCGKNFAYKSELMMLVVAAMRTIGEEKMTGEEKQKFVEYIETLSVSEFNHDIKLVPAWVRKILIAR